LQQPGTGLPYTIGVERDGLYGGVDMRKLLPGSVALIALGLSIPAMAADLEVSGGPAYKAARPVVRVYDWTGFYVGGNVGGHWGSDKITTITDPAGAFGADAATIDALSPATLNPTGFVGGLQAGYNLEGSGGVFGIEVDANWLGGSATRTLPIPLVGTALTNTVQATFLSTLRMRWGTTILSDRSLLFVTAGFAFETLKTADSIGFSSINGSITQPGLAVGGGFEYALTDNISAKAEYLYIAVKHVNPTIPATLFSSSIAVDHNYFDQIGRFGLNFKFFGG
jgi:outer membrane immunogenic protein